MTAESVHPALTRDEELLSCVGPRWALLGLASLWTAAVVLAAVSG